MIVLQRCSSIMTDLYDVDAGFGIYYIRELDLLNEIFSFLLGLLNFHQLVPQMYVLPSVPTFSSPTKQIFLPSKFSPDFYFHLTSLLMSNTTDPIYS